MNKAVKVLSILAFVSVMAFAGKGYRSIEEAAVNSNAVRSYLNKNFTLDGVTYNQHRYIAEPTGNYAWGVAVVNLHGKTGGENSLETTYATVNCEIWHSARGKKGSSYSVSSYEATERVVY